MPAGKWPARCALQHGHQRPSHELEFCFPLLLLLLLWLLWLLWLLLPIPLILLIRFVGSGYNRVAGPGDSHPGALTHPAADIEPGPDRSSPLSHDAQPQVLRRDGCRIKPAP